jgi:peptidyl-prolyl cis-trans isomerase SurA
VLARSSPRHARRARSAHLEAGVASRLAAAVLGVACVVAWGATSATAEEEKLVEGIAAQVGAEIVLASEVFEMSGPIEARMREAGAPEAEILRVRRDALERLIEGKLLSSVVERLELGADREEVDAAIEAIAADNGLSIEQLLTSVTSHGLTLEEYRQKIKGEIERGKVLNAMVRSRVNVERVEVEALFDERFGGQPQGGEEVYVRHLVVLPEGRSASTAAEACRVVAEARDEIASGASEFPDVARNVSDMNPERGGDLGWLHRKDLAGWMAESIDVLEPGGLSPVIEMPFGCNLLQLVDRRSFEPITFEQAAPQLQSYLYNQKMEVEYTKWLDVLRDQTYIERKGAFGS